MQYTLNNEIELSTDIIKKLTEKHMSEISYMNKLERYYLNNNDINMRIFDDETKPNNKVSNAYASYISDTLTGYFVGTPITYNTKYKDSLEFLASLQATFNYNDESDVNMELAKDMSIFGVAYELLYVDTDGQTRFKNIDPREIIVVYDDTIENELLYVIRHYDCEDIVNDDIYMMVEVYSRDTITTYKTSSSSGGLQLISECNHYFELVPIVEYRNNEYLKGDFENVIPLIDAYDKLSSDGINDAEYFSNAYMKWTGVNPEALSEKSIDRNNRNIFLPDADMDVNILTKDVAGQENENKLNRIDKDIHRFAKVVNMNDENFGNNASGISLKSKLQTMENVISIKERKFKRGLQRRIELISKINAIIGQDFDYRSIDIVFTRNLPTSYTEISDVVSKLANIVSTETLLSIIPFVDDIQAELERISAENETKAEQNALYDLDISEDGDLIE